MATGLATSGAGLCSPDDLRFLEGLTRDVVDAARVRRGESRPGCCVKTNTCADAIVTPGGCYPSFWIRDFAMSVPSGLFPTEELAGAVRLTFGAQADAETTCRSGAVIPKGAIPDHIRFDGVPVFFPGTYEPEKQGGPWGVRPPHDDAYYAILMAGEWVRLVGSSAPLRETIRGVPLLDRMDLAFGSSDVARDGTELAWADEATRGVGFGFCDSITHTGHLLFASVLRWQAARRLADLHAGVGDAAGFDRYAAVAARIAASVPRIFGQDDGWLLASTGRSAQKDIWGTAYAVWTGLLQGESRRKAAQALARALKAGTIAEKGNIRHVPTDADFSDKTAWEISCEPFGTYQNGTYWGTPSGWVAAAVAETDEDAARQLVADYLAELRTGDFRLGAGHRSPLECFLTRTRYARNPVYMTSVTCPFAVLSALAAPTGRALSPMAGADVGYRIMRDFDEALWVWPEKPGEAKFFRFRADFVSDGSPLEMAVSADERYVLLLDGKELSRGPARGMPSHWFCQRVKTDVAPGKHRLEAVVWTLGAEAPRAQLSAGGGFLLKADGGYDAALTTGRGLWRAAPLAGTRTDGQDYDDAFGVGPQFRVTGESFLTEEPAVPFAEVKATSRPLRKKTSGGVVYGKRCVFESGLPEMMRRPVKPKALPTTPLVVPARGKRTLTFDLGDYWCAYPQLTVSGGKGAKVRWGWAEATVDEKGRKLHRDRGDGLFTQANFDTFLPDGRKGAVMTVPWWRCGRWCRLEIQTGAEPLTVDDLTLVETRYPLERQGSFAAEGDESLAAIARLCERGVEMCAHEIMFDCPFYEQQMYTGDILMSFSAFRAMTRDMRLPRQALELFDAARQPSGLLPMNWPSAVDQRSTTFTLSWVIGVGEMARWGGSESVEWLKDRLVGVTHTLLSYARMEDVRGLLVDPPGWNFLDWVPDWMKNGGMPPNGRAGDGLDANVNLLYLRALGSAAAVAEATGETELAERWRKQAVRLAAAICDTFWCEERGLVADTPAKDRFSELAQAQAIVTDCLPPDRRARAFEGLVSASDLTRASVMKHFVFAAYFRQGRGDLFLRDLDQWRAYVRDGLRCPLESPAFPRSDCHAFGSTPLYHFHAGLAGVQPAAPLFAKVRVAPSPGGLKGIRSRTPHPRGFVETDLRFDDNGTVTGTVVLPEGVTGVFEWKGRSRPLVPGTNTVEAGRHEPEKAAWMRGKVGVLTHYLLENETAFRQVGTFDVACLVADLKRMKADYYILTLGQNSGFYCSPNAVYERLVGVAPGTRCSTRDVPAEIIAALKGSGIRFGLYLPCQAPFKDFAAARRLGFPDRADCATNDRPFTVVGAANWAQVVREWCLRYGRDVDLWWFDGGRRKFGFTDEMAALYKRVVREGNPDAAVAFNAGVRGACAENQSDYWAGEENFNVFEAVPDGPLRPDNVQWHVLTFLGNWWGEPSVRADVPTWRDWLDKATSRGGAVTLDMAITVPGGRLAPGQVSVFKQLKEM